MLTVGWRERSRKQLAANRIEAETLNQWHDVLDAEADQRGKSSPLYTITPAQAHRFNMWLTHVQCSPGTETFWKTTLQQRRYVPTTKHTHTLFSSRHRTKSSPCSCPWLWGERERSALAQKRSNTDFYQSVQSQRAEIKDAGKRLFVCTKTDIKLGWCTTYRAERFYKSICEQFSFCYMNTKTIKKLLQSSSSKQKKVKEECYFTQQKADNCLNT